jgi:hypothetical protein
MAYDHFIAQTYLRHFLSGREQLRVYRKSGKPSRGHWPQSICGEINGDLVSDFLANPNHIGELRKLFEPRWNSALAALEARNMSADMKFVVAGFMSNLLGATPTSTRLTLESYRHHVIETARAYQILGARRGKGDSKLAQAIELIDAGKLKVDVDNDWARATNASHLVKFAWKLYNSDWTIIANDTPVKFITSDNPFVFEDPGPFRGGKPMLPRYLPLSPKLCLYVVMDPHTDFGEPDFAKPPQGRVQFARTERVLGVEFINERVIECAEELVVSSGKIATLEPLVTKYAHHRVSNEFLKITQPNGFILGMRFRVWDPIKNNQKQDFPPPMVNACG